MHLHVGDRGMELRRFWGRLYVQLRVFPAMQISESVCVVYDLQHNRSTERIFGENQMSTNVRIEFR